MDQSDQSDVHQIDLTVDGTEENPIDLTMDSEQEAHEHAPVPADHAPASIYVYVQEPEMSTTEEEEDDLMSPELIAIDYNESSGTDADEDTEDSFIDDREVLDDHKNLRFYHF